MDDELLRPEGVQKILWIGRSKVNERSAAVSFQSCGSVASFWCHVANWSAGSKRVTAEALP